jgi:hypothetical protein
MDERGQNGQSQTSTQGMSGYGGFGNLDIVPTSDLVAAVVDSDSVRTSLKKKNPTGAMLRSLIFPGWGQFYNGNYWKAGLAFAAETGLIATAVYWNQQAAHATDRDERLLYQHNRNTAYWWLAGTILLSMLDAYVDAHLSDFDESPDLTLMPTDPFAWGSRGLMIQFKIGL